MGRKKNDGPKYDDKGIRMVMRKRDYMADMGGQLALGLMANLVGQLTYFYTDKVGAAVVAVRRSGGVPTFEQLNNFINYSEMLMPTSNYWNVIHGTVPGEVSQDGEGKQIMSVLGQNMAWLMKLVENGKETIKEPEAQNKVRTHFIR